jgi:hypothetical protein
MREVAQIALGVDASENRMTRPFGGDDGAMTSTSP